MDTIAAWIQPDELPAALNLLALLEESGRMCADDAANWRLRIVGWAKFYELDVEDFPERLRPERGQFVRELLQVDVSPHLRRHAASGTGFRYPDVLHRER